MNSYVAGKYRRISESFGLAWVSSLTLATKMLIVGIQLIAVSASARVLGPQGKGLADALQSNVLFFFRVGQFGLIAPIIYTYGKQEWSVSDFAGTLAAFASLSSVVLCAAQVGIFVLWGDRLYPSIHPSWFLLSLLVLPCQLLSILLLTIIRSMEKAVLYNALSLVGSVVAVALVVACLLLLPEVIGLVAARSTAAVFSAVLILWALRRIAPDRWRFNWDLATELVRGGSVLWLGALCNYLYTAQLGPMMVNSLSDATNAGYFAIASRLAGMLLFLPLAVEAFLYPQASRAPDQDAQVLVARTCRHTVFWTLCAGSGLILVSRLAILAVAGPAFMPAASTTGLLVPGIVLHSITMMVMAMLIRKREFAKMTGLNVMLAGLNVLGAFLIVPRWGANGLAIVTSLVYALGASVSMLLFARLTGLSVTKLVVLDSEDLRYYLSLYHKLRRAWAGSR